MFFYNTLRNSIILLIVFFGSSAGAQLSLEQAFPIEPPIDLVETNQFDDAMQIVVPVIPGLDDPQLSPPRCPDGTDLPIYCPEVDVFLEECACSSSE